MASKDQTAATAFMQVTTAFITVVRGEELEYHEGEVVAVDDPIVKRMPDHFGPLKVRSHTRRVEQATRAPGEERS